MIYFFNSTRKNELKNPITIMSNNLRRAEAIAIIKFKEWGYKGTPVNV